MALSAARYTQSKNLGPIKQYLMKASTTIYAGGLVALDSNGLAIPAAASSGNLNVVGVATTTVTSAASGSYYVDAQIGMYLFAATSITQAMVNTTMYAVDDQTIDDVDTGNLPVAGILTEWVSNTSGWVWVGYPYSLGATKKIYQIFSFYIGDMTKIADGDLVTGVIPGFAGTIEKCFWVQGGVPVTTGAKAANLNLEIGSTNVAGGVIALTSAACTPMGKYIAGSAITADNVFTNTDTIAVEASGTTAFVEGDGTIYIVTSQTAKI